MRHTVLELFPKARPPVPEPDWNRILREYLAEADRSLAAGELDGWPGYLYLGPGGVKGK